MTLPEDFLHNILPVLKSEEHEAFLESLTAENRQVSIRLNKKKATFEELPSHEELTPVGWCSEGYYMQQRPTFTADPLLHAGGYYVQEASSMFLSHCLRSVAKQPVHYLDLCAAPGGKTTLAISSLPEGSQVVCNEIDRKRARILAENVCKWGSPYVSVTSNAPADFAALRNTFDIILTDVPCSGEGMFRKDDAAISDWSLQKVEECCKLQHKILDDIWPTLKPGGILIYSTCTFNISENEKMLEYICKQLGAEAIEIPIEQNWHIHPPLVGDLPCYRFMPHFTRGEGLFMAVVRKNGDMGSNAPKFKDKGKGKGNNKQSKDKPLLSLKEIEKQTQLWTRGMTSESYHLEITNNETLHAIPESHYSLHSALKSAGLFLLSSGIELASIKGRDLIPAHALALSQHLSPEAFPRIDVDYATALSYLRRETINLPETVERGYVLVCYQNHPLGFVKNLGNRCNNLYPQEWRIRHISGNE